MQAWTETSHLTEPSDGEEESELKNWRIQNPNSHCKRNTANSPFQDSETSSEDSPTSSNHKNGQHSGNTEESSLNLFDHGSNDKSLSNIWPSSTTPG